MKTLAVCFSRPNEFKLLSWLIMEVDNRPFSHVSISWYSDTLEREIVYQASHLAVNFQEGSNFLKTNTVIDLYRLQLDDLVFKKVIQFAMDTCGKPYGIKQIFGIAIVKAFELLGRRIRNPFKDNESTYVCCELVGKILQEQLNFNIEYDLDTITPGELQKVLIQNSSKF